MPGDGGKLCTVFDFGSSTLGNSWQYSGPSNDAMHEGYSRCPAKAVMHASFHGRQDMARIERTGKPGKREQAAGQIACSKVIRRNNPACSSGRVYDTRVREIALDVIMKSVFRLAARRRRLPRRSVIGIRAGERKTDWTKPLPPPPWLWALNVGGSFGVAVLGHFQRSNLRGRQGIDVFRCGNRAFEKPSQSGSGRLASVRRPRRQSLHKRSHFDLVDNSAS
jgi:hypothetical protein